MENFNSALAIDAAFWIECRNSGDIGDECALEKVVDIRVGLLERQVDGECREAREFRMEFVEEVEFVLCAAYCIGLCARQFGCF